MSRSQSPSLVPPWRNGAAPKQGRIEAAFGAPLRPRRKKPKNADRNAKASAALLQQPLVRAPAPSGVQTGVVLVDLFACIGGFSTGAAQAGHAVVLAVDCDPVSLSVHAENHPHYRHVEMWLGPDTEDELVGEWAGGGCVCGGGSFSLNSYTTARSPPTTRPYAPQPTRARRRARRSRPRRPSGARVR